MKSPAARKKCGEDPDTVTLDHEISDYEGDIFLYTKRKGTWCLSRHHQKRKLSEVRKLRGPRTVAEFVPRLGDNVVFSAADLRLLEDFTAWKDKGA